MTIQSDGPSAKANHRTARKQCLPRELLAQVRSTVSRVDICVKTLELGIRKDLQDKQAGVLPPIHSLFGKALFPIQFAYTAPRELPSIVHLARALIDFEQYKATAEYYYTTPKNLTQEERSKLRQTALAIDILCLYRWGVPYKKLLVRLGGGDQRALCKILEIDKTFVLSRLCSQSVLRAQYAGDWKLLESIGNAIASQPNCEPRYMLPSLLVVAYHWEDIFSVQSYTFGLGLLEDFGVVPRGAEDPRTFSRRLNRVGLKKSKYNRKCDISEES